MGIRTSPLDISPTDISPLKNDYPDISPYLLTDIGHFPHAIEAVRESVYRCPDNRPPPSGFSLITASARQRCADPQIVRGQSASASISPRTIGGGPRKGLRNGLRGKGEARRAEYP